MSPIGTKHAACVNRLVNLLIQLLGKRVILAAQNPVALNDNSEPQPDVALLKPRDDFYATAHPQPQDILPHPRLLSSSALSAFLAVRF